MSVSSHVKSIAATFSAEEVLRQRTGALLGVSPDAQTALETLNIHTVFDLAASSLFATASTLASAETDPTLAEARLNETAADAVERPSGVPVTELARHSVGILEPIGSGGAAAFSSALSVTTVRDLAFWPPYRAAKMILQSVLGGDERTRAALEAPPELRPTSGVYPTERVFYTKLLIDVAPQPQQGVEAIETAGQIDITTALADANGFQRVATGALLTFSQSWFSQGLTLGQLLHSTALAPGESTRIAVVDWSRRSRAGTTETISETEDLTNEQVHSRALSEVTNATATEFQSGTSSSTVTSTTSQSGSAFGVELGPLAFGGSSGSSGNATEAVSASSSFGQRDMASSLAQTVNDRSQQHASAARTRRASIVREVSQQEHERISTRVVTNYNHMHALTVQYYEVVQAFRVTTQLERAERCLFVPMKLLDFRDVSVIDRLRPLLAASALTPAAFRQLTTEYGVVEVIPQTPRVFAGGLLATAALTASAFARAVPHVSSTPEPAPAPPPPSLSTPAPASTADMPAPVGVALERGVLGDIAFERGPANAAISLVTAKGWKPEQVNRLGVVSGLTPVRLGSDSVYIPDEAVLLSVALRSGEAVKFQVRRRDGTALTPAAATATSMVLATPVAFSELQSIALQNAADAEMNTALILNLSVGRSVLSIDVPIQFRSRTAIGGMQEVVRFGNVRASRELVAHLDANRLHYSRAVFQRLDATAVAALLGHSSYSGLPLLHLIDPQPFAVTGNFLVFRMNVPLAGDLEDERLQPEREAFQKFLEDRGLVNAEPSTDIVPLPSGGVFAEAVLGRFNCAEKIDLKRFFNWQDSPIPITAPEIAPVNAGSRSQAEDLRPGQLGPPVVNIQTPVALPAAAGVSPALFAIQASPFRDMSGIAQTAALAQAAAQASGAGATAAGEQAAKNLFTVMDQKTQRLRIAADLLGSMMGAGGSGGGTAGTGGGGDKGPSLTTRGGQLAKAEQIDAAAAADPSGASTTLQKQTLEQQTGAGAAGMAEKVAEAAAATPEPDTAAPPKASARRRSPTASPVSTSPAEPTSASGLGGVGDMVARAAKPPRRFRVDVLFTPTGGVQIDGNYQVKFFSARGKVLFSAAGSAQHGVFAEFETSDSIVTIHVTATTAKGFGFVGVFPLSMPPQRISHALAGFTRFKVQIRPVLMTVRLMVPVTGILQPDRAALEQQLTQQGITAAMRAGEPSFELALGQGFRATVRYFAPMLLFEQVIS